MIRGINYPWTVFDGRANYGCDFGRNKWGSHTGVTAHAQDVRDDFQALRAANIEVARWFVFTDGRSGIIWNSDGEIDGLDAEFFADMDRTLRELGVSDVTVGKKVRRIAESYYGRVTAYDRALAAGPGILEEAISRNIYPDGASGESTRAMADYFGSAVKQLGTIPVEQILLGELRFP